MFFMDYQTVRMLNARKFIYTLSGTVPAANSPQAGALPLSKSVQAGYDFWSELLTMVYTSLASDGTDNGVCPLSVQFQDGANQVAMSNDSIDLALISAPGRQRSVGVAGDPSNPLNVPGIPYPYLWSANGQIIANLRNSSNTANLFEAAFNGYLIPEASRAMFDNWLQSQAAAAAMPAPAPGAMGMMLYR